MDSPKALDVHARFVPPPHRRALQWASVTKLDDEITVPEWDLGTAIEVMDQAGFASVML